MTSVVSAITTYTDGFGRWFAHLTFSQTLSGNDPRPEFSLSHQWARIRATARTAIVRKITDREQKTGETRRDAERRVRESLHRLVLIDQDIDAMNHWRGVTFGER